MLSIREIARSSSKISGVNIVGGALAAGANILVARHLGPDALGVVGFVQLWLLYANFARPGLIQSAFREMLELHGKGQEAEARRLQDVALTTEILFLAAPASVLAGVGFLFAKPEQRLGLWIGAATFLATSLYQLVDTIQWTHRRFSLITRVTLFLRISQPVLLVLGAWTLGIYGVLLAPLGATAAALAYYRFRTAAAAFTPTWDPPEARRMALAGLPLVVNGFLYWSFRTSDRTLVAALLPLAALGHFTFAMTFITQGCQVVSDFLNVLQTALFTELGAAGAVRPLAGRIQRLSLLILLATGSAAGAAQSLFAPFVALAAPRFMPGVPAFEVLALNLVCTTAPLLAFSVLLSSTVDRRHACNLLQAAGLALNLIIGWALTLKGYGLVGIAWSSAISQLVVALGAHALLHPYLFQNAPAHEAPRFYRWAAGLAALPFILALTLSRLAPTPKAAVVSAVWMAAAGLCYHAWWKGPPPANEAAC